MSVEKCVLCVCVYGWGPTEMMGGLSVSGWSYCIYRWIQGESNATTMMPLELLLAAAVSNTDCLAGPEHDVRAPVPAPFTFPWTARARGATANSWHVIQWAFWLVGLISNQTGIIHLTCSIHHTRYNVPK